ncbi:DUF2284 domain-containing protein [Methanocella sp. MCL-LM]|uniref:DUF2284 domain-containing protein n=1 Tax=Methanocella sp. MCL-LM TaxID=3412035 RepID=UPI003C76FDD8
MAVDFGLLEKELQAMAMADGATEFKRIHTHDISTAHWVRQKCQFGCPNYGLRLSCPPYTPGSDETRKVLDGYANAYILGYDGYLYLESNNLSQKDDWISGFGAHVRKSMLDLERHAFLEGYHKALTYGFGGCRRCETCAIAQGNTTCKFPAEFRTSMEAAGIDVLGTLKTAGLELSLRGEKEVTRRGQVVFHVLLLLG